MSGESASIDSSLKLNSILSTNILAFKLSFNKFNILFSNL